MSPFTKKLILIVVANLLVASLFGPFGYLNAAIIGCVIGFTSSIVVDSTEKKK